LCLGTEKAHELVVDDLDKLLAGRYPRRDFRAEGFLPDGRRKRLDDLEIYVGFQQG